MSKLTCKRDYFTFSGSIQTSPDGIPGREARDFADALRELRRYCIMDKFHNGFFYAYTVDTDGLDVFDEDFDNTEIYKGRIRVQYKLDSAAFFVRLRDELIALCEDYNCYVVQASATMGWYYIV